MPESATRVVMKFGGTSVGTIERIKHVARYVKKCHEKHQVLVVVSAMSGQTDHLISLAQAISQNGDPKEYDSIVSTGEQISSSLLSLALGELGSKARSFLGWQIPIYTDDVHHCAHIEKIEASSLIKTMDEGIIPVIAGFQGVTRQGRISTLGRGGSDTSAVAIAAAVNADKCDIYTDVDGVYTTDPRIVPQARRIDKISYEEMLELSSVGAKVLHPRSVSLAMVEKMPVQVISTFNVQPDKDDSQLKGSLVTDNNALTRKNLVTGIACTTKEARISIQHVPDRPGIAARIFSVLAGENINVDMIVQSTGVDGTTSLTFTIPKTELEKTIKLLKSAQSDYNYDNVTTDSDVAKISIVGRGMHSHTGVASKMFETLYEHAINIQAISTSEIKISVLVEQKHAQTAVKALHKIYGLENA